MLKIAATQVHQPPPPVPLSCSDQIELRLPPLTASTSRCRHTLPPDTMCERRKPLRATFEWCDGVLRCFFSSFFVHSPILQVRRRHLLPPVKPRKMKTTSRHVVLRVSHLRPLPQSRRPLQRCCRSCMHRRAVEDEVAVTFVLHHHSPPLVSLRLQLVGVPCCRRSPPRRGYCGVSCVSQSKYVCGCYWSEKALPPPTAGMLFVVLLPSLNATSRKTGNGHHHHREVVAATMCHRKLKTTTLGWWLPLPAATGRRVEWRCARFVSLIRLGCL
ncbi:unnamed protein product [Lactuca saligna]|uniref:Uncharacterized protein n=1 Tax=Lactuca saligna TaxID=75948 RepID=A0AA36EIT1_LACSI|nr:unnamed protein product [Lactuca saligna]